jgi:thiol-disulfide isomerase/thioredoxin
MALMSLRRIAAASVLIPALVSVSCGSGGDATPTPLVLTSPRAMNATSAPLLPTSRFALPDFDYARFQALLHQLRGTPVVVNFWGSWCAPCYEEAPKLAEAARRFGHRVQFLGVDVLDKRAEAQAYIRDRGWSFPSVFDPSRQILTGYGLPAPPITLLFDRSGKQVDHFTGPIPSLARLVRGLDKVV